MDLKDSSNTAIITNFVSTGMESVAKERAKADDKPNKRDKELVNIIERCIICKKPIKFEPTEIHPVPQWNQFCKKHDKAKRKIWYKNLNQLFKHIHDPLKYVK